MANISQSSTYEYPSALTSSIYIFTSLTCMYRNSATYHLSSHPWILVVGTIGDDNRRRRRGWGWMYRSYPRAGRGGERRGGEGRGGEGSGSGSECRWWSMCRLDETYRGGDEPIVTYPVQLPIRQDYRPIDRERLEVVFISHVIV